MYKSGRLLRQSDKERGERERGDGAFLLNLGLNARVAIEMFLSLVSALLLRPAGHFRFIAQ